jgi:hypothetical protein
VAPAANAGKKGKGKGTPNKGGGDGGGGKKFEPVPFINVMLQFFKKNFV